jgi:hypothetical protein
MTVRIFAAAAIVVAALAPAAAQDAAFTGTYTQNQACKGGGQDPANKLVTINDNEVVSNFGPCALSNKQVDGKVFKAQGVCKNKGMDIDVDVSFTLKDNNTIDFVEGISGYKSVLNRCPAGTPPAVAK